VGTMLDILHCVMFPVRPPMFGCDLVGGQISAAIADLSPLSLIGQCPVSIAVHLRRYLSSTLAQRELPAWEIFFRILLYSTQLPSGRSDVSLRGAGVSFIVPKRSRRNLYQLNNRLKLPVNATTAINSRTTKPECWKSLWF